MTDLLAPTNRNVVSPAASRQNLEVFEQMLGKTPKEREQLEQAVKAAVRAKPGLSIVKYQETVEQQLKRKSSWETIRRHVMEARKTLASEKKIPQLKVTPHLKPLQAPSVIEFKQAVDNFRQVLRDQGILNMAIETDGEVTYTRRQTVTL